tara:strand:+ start:876 stop:1208 length:333 start_codon:yes stop_codon:yes gene_type:complete
VPVSTSNVKQPYELSESEWSAKLANAQSGLRGNLVPGRVTRSTGSQMVAHASVIDWLHFGIRKDLSDRLKKVQDGTLVLSSFGSNRLVVMLERPTTYKDVIRKAKRLNLL